MPISRRKSHRNGIDTWRGDQHAGGYDETTFAQVSEHNRANYESFSTLLRSEFDGALSQFEPGLPGFLEQLLAPPSEHSVELAMYYTERAAAMQEQIARHWRDGTIRNTPFAQQTIIQVFYTTDGSHREEDSVYARVGHQGWKDVRIELPPGAGASPLRIDFVSALTTIEIESLRLTKGSATCFAAEDATEFEAIKTGGDVERLPDATALRVRATGVDPQLYLPRLDLPAGDEPLILEMRLRVLC